ncbi:hypothetical protein ES705_30157 [subsurface metagenome]
MVKITNLAGDVKIGRQGEVVYQRKYGEQIRRGVSPKRAIASKAQIAHRQLYRDALDWRHELSLPNRRYLERYTYANGVVDLYHIPLGWSRFALKLYLEKVRFTLSDVQVEEQEEVNTKHESFDPTPNSYQGFGLQRWDAQTFLTTDAFELTSVKVKLYRTTPPGQIIVSIRDAQAANKPAGEDLTLGTTDGDTLTTSTSGEWREITLTPCQLEGNHRYAIVARAPDAGEIAHARWAARKDTGLYANGRMCYSNNYGDTWSTSETYDLLFQTWEHIEASYLKTAILHVKHPALMKVVHKRGELTIQAHEGLSSLDDEYLTGQVGLDVEAGDLVWATTVAGVLYPYLVK